MIVDSLPAPAQALLDDCHCLSLAFSDADGPWAVPLYFFADRDADLYFTSSANSRHGLLPEGHAAAASIFREPADWRAIRGVQGVGRLRPVSANAAPLVREHYLQRFPDLARLIAAPSDADEQRIARAFSRNSFFALRLERLRLIDNEAGFATRSMFVRDKAGSWVLKPPTAKTNLDRK